jgi:hypothetical protein
MRHSVCRSVVNVARRRHGSVSRASRSGESRGSPRRPARDHTATAEHHHDLPLETVVTATERAHRTVGMEPEHRAVVELARRPVSLAEISAALTVPMAVVRGLVAQLDDRGLLDVHVPSGFPGGRPTADVLARLLKGLRAR